MKLTMSAIAAAVLTATAASAQENPQVRVVEPKISTTAAGDRYVLRSERMLEELKAQQVRPRVPVESKTVTGAPYSAEVITEHIQTLSDGNRIVRRTSGRVYRDSQGRTRREEDKAPGQVGLITINDPVATVAYSLNPDTRTATKTMAGNLVAAAVIDWKMASAKADPAEIERRKAVEAEIAVAAAQGVGTGRGGGGGGGRGRGVGGAVAPAGGLQRAAWETKTEKLPARTIEGVMAEGARTTQTIPAGAIGNEQPILIVNEEWRSPELQVLVLTRSADPRTGESVYRLTNITRAEPNPSWFEVPSDYTVKEYAVKFAPVVK